MSDTPTGMDPESLASAIKTKFPGKYDSRPTGELTKAWLQKYPAYWKNVDAASFSKLGMYQPASTEAPAQFPDHKETPSGKAIETGGKALVGALPMIGGTVGGALGAMGAGPAGAVMGAAAGGAAGKNIENRFEGQDPHTGTGGAAITQGATELIGGQVLPKMLENIGANAVPKVYKALSNYIGLKPSDLPKWGRTAEEADKITKTVLQEAGVKKTLEAQKDAIEAARQAHDAATVKIVQAPGAKTTDFHSVAIDRAVKLLGEVEKEGVPQEQLNAIDKNLEGVTSNIKANMTPSELLDTKRSIQKQITTWDRNTTNIRQRYLQGLYDDINHAIVSALPKDAAADFRAHNVVQTHLITAREAAKEKLLAQQLKATPGIATRTVRGVVKPIVGATIGATVGGATEGRRGAVIGGLVGAGAGTVAEKLGTAELPAMDVKAQQAIAKAAPYLAKVTKKTVPTAARTLEAIQNIQSRPQNQP